MTYFKFLPTEDVVDVELSKIEKVPLPPSLPQNYLQVNNFFLV